MIGVFEYDEEKQRQIIARDSKIEGVISSIITLLSNKGVISESLEKELVNITDLEKLNELLLLASKVETVEEFESNF